MKRFEKYDKYFYIYLNWHEKRLNKAISDFKLYEKNNICNNNYQKAKDDFLYQTKNNITIITQYLQKANKTIFLCFALIIIVNLLN